MLNGGCYLLPDRPRQEEEPKLQIRQEKQRVHDQGHCGTCVSWATAGVVEHLLKRKYKFSLTKQAKRNLIGSFVRDTLGYNGANVENIVLSYKVIPLAFREHVALYMHLTLLSFRCALRSSPL